MNVRNYPQPTLYKEVGGERVFPVSKNNIVSESFLKNKLNHVKCVEGTD